MLKLLLDAIVQLMPSPVDVPAITGINDDESEGVRNSNDDEPFAALAFKIATDPYVGTLTFFRVYSGVLRSGDTVYNPVKSKKERVGRILQMHSNSREEIKEVLAGDIAAAAESLPATSGRSAATARPSGTFPPAPRRQRCSLVKAPSLPK